MAEARIEELRQEIEASEQLPETEKAVDLIIDILDARVGYHGGAIAILGEILRCLDENLTGGLRLEAQNQLPGQNSPTEIVDHRVQIRARAIKQSDDRSSTFPRTNTRDRRAPAGTRSA